MSTAVYNALFWKDCKNVEAQVTSCVEALRTKTISEWRRESFKDMIFEESLLESNAKNIQMWLRSFYESGIYTNYAVADEFVQTQKNDDPLMQKFIQAADLKLTTVRAWQDPKTNKWYGNVSASFVNPHKILESVGLGVDFSYWNQTDPDPSVSERKWNHRYAVWNRIDLDQPFMSKSLNLKQRDFISLEDTLQCMRDYIESDDFVERVQRSEMHKKLEILEKMGLLPTISSVLEATDNPEYIEMANHQAAFLVHRFRQHVHTFLSTIHASHSTPFNL